MTNRDRILWIASAIGYGLGLAALVLVIQHDGGLAYDARSYWLAGRHAIDGLPLYEPSAINGPGPYRYPPLFAQLWAPLAILPELAFAWVWRGFCFLCLHYLAGSWRNVGLWLLFPFTLTELSAANVTLPVAAALFASFRGRPELAPLAGALKFGGFLVVPYLWLTRPAERRRLWVGLGALFLVCLLSFLLAPDDWVLYSQALAWQAGSNLEGSGLIRLLPTASADFALRLVIACAVVGYAFRVRSDRLVYAIAVITVPVVWVARLPPLLATYRLDGARRRFRRHGAAVSRAEADAVTGGPDDRDKA